MITEIGLLAAGVAIASASMSIGIGGGILWTPLLILAYGLSPQEAISTSLLIQIVGMGSGSVAYFKARLVETRLSLIFFLAALPGVIIGSYLTITLAQETIQMALGIMAMTLAMLFVGDTEFDGGGSYRFVSRQVMRIIPIPMFFGFIMGSLSAGIGEWLIPSLRNRLKLGMTRAIGTVIPMMFLLAVVASIVHYSFADSVRFDYFMWGALGTLAGGQIGAHISQRINERLLKQSFIYLMTLIGIHLIFHAI